MKSLSRLPIDAVLALAEQAFEELIAIRPLDRIAVGDRGDAAQSGRIDHLLSSLYAVCARVKHEFQGRVRSDDMPALAVAPSHAEFLRTKLLPNVGAIEQAYFADSPLLLEMLGTEADLQAVPARGSIRDALWFTTAYTNDMMGDPDDRRHNVDTAFALLDEPWFVPDLWDANVRSLRPVILGLEASRVPQRIRFRVIEMHRSFVFGAWMAAVALSRAVVEFALIERAPSIGFSATQTSRAGVEEYLSLQKLVANASEAMPELSADLERLRDAGNRILHPKKKQNVVPLPRVLREEAFACIESATRVLELLYARHRAA
jgi:hypothetical protein